MRLIPLSSPALGLVAAGLLGAGLSLGAAADLAAQGADPVTVGAAPSFQFQQSLYNGRGVKSLADLRGAPTIIEFWGTA